MFDELFIEINESTSLTKPFLYKDLTIDAIKCLYIQFYLDQGIGRISC